MLGDLLAPLLCFLGLGGGCLLDLQLPGLLFLLGIGTRGNGLALILALIGRLAVFPTRRLVGGDCLVARLIGALVYGALVATVGNVIGFHMRQILGGEILVRLFGWHYASSSIFSMAAIMSLCIFM